MVATIVIYIQKPQNETSTDAMLAHIFNEYLDACARDPTLSNRLQMQAKIVRAGPSGGIVDQDGNATPTEVKMTPMIFDGTNPTLPGDFVKAGNTSVQTALRMVRAFGVSVRMATLHSSFASWDRDAAAPATAYPAVAPASTLPPPHPGVPTGLPGTAAAGAAGGYGDPRAMMTTTPHSALAEPSPFLPGTPDYLKGEICDDVGNVPSRGNLGGAAITVGASGTPDMAALIKEREASMNRLQSFIDGGAPGAMPGAGGAAATPAAMPSAPYAAGGGPGRLATVMPPPDVAPASGRFVYGM